MQKLNTKYHRIAPDAAEILVLYCMFEYYFSNDKSSRLQTTFYAITILLSMKNSNRIAFTVQ